MNTAIIVSIGKRQIEEQGWRFIVKEMLRCTGDPTVYFHRLTNQPIHKENIITVFIVAGGRVRFRATVVDFISKQKITFDNGKSMEASFVVLVDFKRVRIKIPLKGFQGFRYVKEGTELSRHYEI